MIHKDQKPFSCQHCEKAFRQLGKLKEHIHGHHSEDNPYRCKECDKCFTAGSSLRGHMNSKEHAKEMYLRFKMERNLGSAMVPKTKHSIYDPLA